MSDKDTIPLSEALKLEREIYEQIKVRQQKPPEPDYISELETALSAVEGERDNLAALVLDFVVIAPTSDPSDYNAFTWLGVAKDMWQLGTRARRALAALDAAAEDRT